MQHDLFGQLKDRVEHYMATPVTVNVRVTMNNSLRFPALTVCNKNSFNMTQFNLLKQELAFERNLSHHQIKSWGLRDLIGFRGMDVKQLWDSLAHNPNKIISEVFHWFYRIRLIEWFQKHSPTTAAGMISLFTIELITVWMIDYIIVR